MIKRETTVTKKITMKGILTDVTTVGIVIEDGKENEEVLETLTLAELKGFVGQKISIVITQKTDDDE